MKKDFKFNEIIKFYGTAKELGLNPTIILNKYHNGKWVFADIQMQFRNARIYSRLYDSKYLIPRIKSFIEDVNVKKNLIIKER